jgi:hypothetical protein
LTMGNDDVQLDETEFHKTTNNVGIFGSKFRQSRKLISFFITHEYSIFCFDNMYFPQKKA